MKHAYAQTVGGDFGQTYDAFVAHIGALSHFVPLAVGHDVHGEAFYAFAMHCHGFLKHYAVECHFVLHTYLYFVLNFHKSAVIAIEKAFWALCYALEQIVAVGLADAFAHFGEHAHIFVGESTFAIGRYVEQESGIAAHRALVDVENIIG